MHLRSEQLADYIADRLEFITFLACCSALLALLTGMNGQQALAFTALNLPFGLALLLGMGVDTVSAAPRFVPGMKHLIRQFNAQACMELANSVLLSTDVAASKRMVREALQQSLGQELAFHTTSLFTHSHP